MTDAPKLPNRVHVTWAGDQRFDAGRPGGPTVRIDGSGATGPGMVDSVLSALASCTGVDIVEILAKRRTPAERFAVDVTGHRFDGVPRRLVHVLLEYVIDGAGIERAHAERAVELSITKYCSVRDSLDRGIPIEWVLVLNGERGETRKG
jgi:putative redox protein